MIKSLIYSISFHSLMIILTVLSLPFMLREPVDLPPIVSVELIQISDKTRIPYAPKARKLIEEKKKIEEERMVSEQAPPAAKAKEKPDRIPMPNEKKEEKQIIKKKTKSWGNKARNKTIFRVWKKRNNRYKSNCSANR